MATVSAPARRVSSADAGYRRLLVPLSGSAEWTRAMETACALAAEHGATIEVAYVIEVSPLLPLDAQMSEEEAEAKEALARAEAIADAFGLKIRPHTIHARDAGRAIVELVEDEDVELVVIAAPRLRRFRRPGPAFSGTVRHVLAKAPSRVLVVSDRAAAA
jgi:nucleotide-binding universal stress UspA family protein